MKLTIATLATAALFATGASAMVGTYERAVNEAPASSSLFTTGEQEVVSNTASTSPGAEYNNGEAKVITVFENDNAGQFMGAAAR
ncbi:hypothetical protein N4R57_00535 [Rhodobacteraceae bacterium D3-12]|nr:hypothetical protein N4R57_00530 [Rhodobacteraceae bacterium D3-12]UYV37644.1 hypothetical protein N4R57_00535 [Rhodobacteraceae bacterium D3-12]